MKSPREKRVEAENRFSFGRRRFFFFFPTSGAAGQTPESFAVREPSVATAARRGERLPSPRVAAAKFSIVNDILPGEDASVTRQRDESYRDSALLRPDDTANFPTVG